MPNDPRPLDNPRLYREWEHPEYPINTEETPTELICTQCGARAGNHKLKRVGDSTYPMCPQGRTL